MSKIIADEVIKYLDFDNGFFIEVGANDGLTSSNTIALEKRGWRGMLIEPSYIAYNACLRTRGNGRNIIIQAALVSNDYHKSLIAGDFTGHPMSSIGGKRLNNEDKALILVPAYTITELLTQFKIEHVDFFSLDTEGYETEILAGVDFEKWSPTFFLIEWNVGEDDLFPFMESKGYECLGNISQFTIEDDPGWQGQHQDYLFKLKGK